MAATFGWAVSAVLSRAVIIRGVNTWTIIPVRMVVASLTLLLVITLTGRFWTTDPRAWKRGLILGVGAMALPMTLMTLALEDLPVSLGSMLIALIPLATIAAAHYLVDEERFQLRSLPGLIVALVGTVLLVGVGGVTLDGVENLWRGVANVTAGVVLAGVGGALTRRFALEVDAEDLVLPQFTVNTIVVAAVFPVFFPFDLGPAGPVDWLMLIGIGAVGTTLAFAAFIVAAEVNPASRLALTGYSVPVVAVILAVLFLGERPTLSVLAGALLIVLGVIMAERATAKHVPEPGVATAG